MSTQRVTISSRAEVVAQIDAIAEKRRRSRSFIYDEAAEKYLAELSQQNSERSTTPQNGRAKSNSKKAGTR